MLVESQTVTYKLHLRGDSTFFFSLALVRISSYLQLEWKYK